VLHQLLNAPEASGLITFLLYFNSYAYLWYATK